jgi:enoyl-CoA hydratase/carnithine racemase
MSGAILLQREGVVATIVLSHPGRLNALSLPMWRAVASTIETLNADPSLRCVVLRGDGDRAFAAGADIAEFARERSNSTQARVYGEAIDRGMQAVRTSVHPTLAMIQGACVGGGLELAAVCDMRICSESSRFGVPVKNLGLVMGLGELQGLIGLVGRARALEIVLEGRVFGAAEAKEMGLVNRVVPDSELAAECAAAVARIASGAPLVARWHKAFANRLADPHPLEPDELAQNHACFDTEDFQIGYQAFLAKKTPSFEGR